MDEVHFSRIRSYLRTGVSVAVSGYPGKDEGGELCLFASIIYFPMLNPDVVSFARVEAGRRDAAVAAGMSERSGHIERIRDTKVHQIRSDAVNIMRKYIYDSEFMKVKSSSLDMLACMYPDPESWLRGLLFGVGRVYAVGDHYRNGRTGLAGKPELIGCEFFKGFEYNALMELTEKMLSGMMRELTGDYQIRYHANGLDKEPVDIDFRPPFRRVDVMEELARTANLTIPEDLDLSSDVAYMYLMDACNEYGIACPGDQTGAQLLNKLVEVFVEANCVNPTFIVNHPQFKLSGMMDAGLTDRFELFVNKHEVCNGSKVAEGHKASRRMTFPRKNEHQQLGFSVEMSRSGWWLWAFDRIIMLLTDSQDIEEVDGSKYMGPI